MRKYDIVNLIYVQFRFSPINEGEMNSSVNSVDLCTDKHLVELYKRKQEIIMQIERHNMLFRKQMLTPNVYDQYSQISICEYNFFINRVVIEKYIKKLHCNYKL